MHLKRLGVHGLLAAALALAAFIPLVSSPAWGQPPPDAEEGIDVDFLLNYYEQDGDHSPVTGGIGTEELDVIAPVFLVDWRKGGRWSWRAELGVDAITSASTDNMDLGEAVVSGASRLDNRAYTSVTASRALEKQTIGLTLGLSNEYDYQSIRLGGNWSRDFRRQNTTLSAALMHYNDTVELYGIDGVLRGDDDRTTTDLSVSVSQVLGKKTVGSIEVFVSDQSGFLSTPFHEVILAPTPMFAAGQVVAERLPDARTRTAVGLRVNHAFSKKVVGRFYYRFYDDDWGITAGTIEFEPRFRLPTESEMWLYPILRFHSQTESDHFGLPRTLTSGDSYRTADRELGEFNSEKYGLGWKVARVPADRQRGGGRLRWLGGIRSLRRFETRVTTYSRDDGLDSLSASFAFGWTIR